LVGSRSLVFSCWSLVGSRSLVFSCWSLAVGLWIFLPSHCGSRMLALSPSNRLGQAFPPRFVYLRTTIPQSFVNQWSLNSNSSSPYFLFGVTKIILLKRGLCIIVG
jgi:hypothetical protein